jgi:hypothetical protein
MILQHEDRGYTSKLVEHLTKVIDRKLEPRSHCGMSILDVKQAPKIVN